MRARIGAAALLGATKALLLATSLPCLTLAATSVASAQEVLPFPPKPSGSIANRTMQESVYSPLPATRRLAGGCAEHPDRADRRCRAGAADDLRRRDQHADARPHRQRRHLLQPLPHHCDVLADPRRASDGAQPPPRRQRADRRAGQRLGRVLRRDPEDERDGRRSLEGLRLRDGSLRQVAQHAGRADHRRRSVRVLADRLWLRIFLRLPRRRGVAVRAASRAKHDRGPAQPHTRASSIISAKTSPTTPSTGCAIRRLFSPTSRSSCTGQPGRSMARTTS